MWGSRGTMSVLQQAVDGALPTKVESLLNQLRSRELIVRLPQAAINAEGYGNECWPINRKVIKDILNQADGILPNSWLELQALRHDLQWDDGAFEIAHYGVDPSLFLDPDPKPFIQALELMRLLYSRQDVLNQQKSGNAVLGFTSNRFSIVLIGGSNIGQPTLIYVKKSAAIVSKSSISAPASIGIGLCGCSSTCPSDGWKLADLSAWRPHWLELHWWEALSDMNGISKEMPGM